MRRRPPSLRRQIVIWYSAVLLVALGIFSFSAYMVMERALERAGTASLSQTARDVEELGIPQQIPRISSEEETFRIRTPAGEELDALQRRTRLATGAVVMIVVTRSDDADRRALRSFLLISLILIPLTAAGAALGGRALLERVLDPLRRLVGAAHEIGIGGLSRRVAVPEEPAEMHELAQSFNGMLTRLQRAVDALRDFTADASHELRTPLTAIQGTIQVALARQRSPEELRQTLEDVQEETASMLHLVDGLLTLARGEEEGEQRAMERVELTPLLEDVVELAGALAAEKAIEVTLEAPEALTVRGSASRLRQVFLNLASNAVRFTERGRVELIATAGAEWVEVRVRDTGAGIAPEELSRVFDRFYRGDAARAQPGGTGLGLAIARLLVEQQGGEIAVTSEPGVGSEFVVRLPAEREPAGELAGGGA